ncbi:MAG: hypothetical protein RL660_330 [Bacteroidota bacterium]
MHPKELSIEQFDYDLPESKIAFTAVEPRDHSKLLMVTPTGMADHMFYDLPNLLDSHSILIANNSKVIPARIIVEVNHKAHVEIFLLEPQPPDDYYSVFNRSGAEGCTWLCFIGKARKWKAQQLLTLNVPALDATISFERLEQRDNAHLVRLTWNTSHPLSLVLEHVGKMPLPPYITREADANDAQRYQTAYSEVLGSVAAPTAGLHFTRQLLDSIIQRGIATHYVSLHVGAGTFAPVKAMHMADHAMHAEQFTVSVALLESLLQALQAGKKVVAVGTTSMRTLESLYWIALQLKQQDEHFTYLSQWTAYDEAPGQFSSIDAVEILLEYLRKEQSTSLNCATQIIIAPGYTFRFVDQLITNFHQPKSTLLLLIAAFVGIDQWPKIYDHALNSSYRFLSYGDSSLLIR